MFKLGRRLYGVSRNAPFTSKRLVAAFTSNDSTNCSSGEKYDRSSHSHSSYSWASRAGPFKLSSFALLFLGSLFLSLDTSENCGIVGVVGSDDANAYVLEGLTILQNRGYDSAGIATINGTNGEMLITKYASRDTTSDSIDLVKENAKKHAGHSTAIGHTRWATHGGKTDSNAHPHTDYKNRIALIHNGTINNSYDLKRELLQKGIEFKSETDTEVIAHLVGINLDAGMNTKDAVAHALSR